MIKPNAILFVGLLLLVPAHLAISDGHERSETQTEKKVTMGAADYFSYCAVCHGLQGEGDGPMFDVLKVPPADLSRIAKRNNGVFPSSRVAETIENGGKLRGHGISSMLAWGKVFTEYDEDVAPEKRIQALTKFIEELQQH